MWSQATPSHWKVPPFSAEIATGSIYGRGAQDMKNEGLAQFMVMVMLKREKVELDRDVIFLAVSDEEVDGTGSDWFIEHQRDLLGNAEFLINEGGENLLDHDGHVKYIGVDVGEKVAILVACGSPRARGARLASDYRFSAEPAGAGFEPNYCLPHATQGAANCRGISARYGPL